MKFLFSLACSIHFISIACCQQQHIKGTVVDRFSHIPLAGVSISFGKSGTTTNSNGFFSITINSANRLKERLILSHVGYITQTVSITANADYIIEMEVDNTALDEVIVSSGAEKIVQKAIAHIGDNYPQHSFSLTGIKRFYRTETDSPKVYRYFKSDAAVVIQYPSYADTATDAVARVLQNRTIYRKPNQPQYDTAEWTGGYLTDDFVHKRAEFINTEEMHAYSYSLVGKTTLQGSRVWIINFKSKGRQHAEGALFIDTASYAFVAAKYARYNIRRLGYQTIERSEYDVIFRNEKDRWYLHRKRQEAVFHFSKANSRAITDFLCTGIQDPADETLYKEAVTVKPHDKDIKPHVPGSDSNWLPYDSLIAKAEYENVFRVIPVPEMAGANGHSTQQGEEDIPFHKRKDYLEQTRMRLSLSADYINVRSSAAGKGAIGIGFGTGVKIYNSMYIHVFSSINFKDANKIFSSKVNFSLLYSVNISKRKTPFYFTTQAGLSMAELSTRKQHYKRLLQYTGGLGISYPLMPKLRPYLRVGYDHTFKATGILTGYYSSPFNISLGSFFSF